MNILHAASHQAYAFSCHTPEKRTAYHHGYADKKSHPFRNDLSPNSLAPLCTNLFKEVIPAQAAVSTISSKLLRWFKQMVIVYAESYLANCGMGYFGL